KVPEPLLSLRISPPRTVQQHWETLALDNHQRALRAPFVSTTASMARGILHSRRAFGLKLLLILDVLYCMQRNFKIATDFRRSGRASLGAVALGLRSRVRSAVGPAESVGANAWPVPEK